MYRSSVNKHVFFFNQNTYKIYTVPIYNTNLLVPLKRIIFWEMYCTLFVLCVSVVNLIQNLYLHILTSYNPIKCKFFTNLLTYTYFQALLFKHPPDLCIHKISYLPNFNLSCKYFASKFSLWIIEAQPVLME